MSDSPATTGSGKPRILFFARGYQADFFPELLDPRYEAVFVTLTRAEAERVRANGCEVVACFEDDFDALEPVEIAPDYLLTSLVADRFLGRYDHDRRLEILGKEVAFWRNLLDRFTPAAVVNELVAIEISEVLLIECRARDIRYLAGMNCFVDEHFYWLPDPIDLSGETLGFPEPSAASRELVKSYFAELRKDDYKPFNVKGLASRRSPRPLAAALVKSTLWWWRERFRGTRTFRYEDYREEYGKRLQVFAASFTTPYDTLEAIPEDTEIVFYPLHQEPEATLNYLSEFHANQVATIENILKCLAPNQVLVVKEHPVDKGALLRRKFREVRAANSALRFLPAEVPGRAVFKRCERIVTLTSTVGWEAACLGKSVATLSKIYFNALPGITRITHLRQLREMLRTPVADLPRLSPETAEHFVASMVEASYPGNPFPFPDLYSQRNIDRVKHAIVDGAGIAEEPYPA